MQGQMLYLSYVGELCLTYERLFKIIERCYHDITHGNPGLCSSPLGLIDAKIRTRLASPWLLFDLRGLAQRDSETSPSV